MPKGAGGSGPGRSERASEPDPLDCHVKVSVIPGSGHFLPTRQTESHLACRAEAMRRRGKASQTGSKCFSTSIVRPKLPMASHCFVGSLTHYTANVGSPSRRTLRRPDNSPSAIRNSSQTPSNLVKVFSIPHHQRGSSPALAIYCGFPGQTHNPLRFTAPARTNSVMQSSFGVAPSRTRSHPFVLYPLSFGLST